MGVWLTYLPFLRNSWVSMRGRRPSSRALHHTDGYQLSMALVHLGLGEKLWLAGSHRRRPRSTDGAPIRRLRFCHSWFWHPFQWFASSR